jgi:hypothetical protein
MAENLLRDAGLTADRMQGPAAAKAEPSGASEAVAEVWLRANPRPAAVLCAAMAAVAMIAAALLIAAHPPAWGVAVVAAACLAGLGVAAAFFWAASRPRLACRGDVLEVRLTPMGMQQVPLEVVECVFPGSQPLGGHDGTADRRVSTVVLRLAERAVEWRSRPVLSAWGSWEEGNVVFDGRWCEPLSQAVARDISARLLEARRRVSPGPS